MFARCQVHPYIVQTSKSEHSGGSWLSGSRSLQSNSCAEKLKLQVSHTCCLLCCAWGKCGKKKEEREHPPTPPTPQHSHPCAALPEQRCTAHTVCTHPVKEPAINKERAIYEHFLSAALWKHITWRRDPLTSSCHSTPSMRQRSQIYRVRGRGRRCRSRPAMASHLTIIGPAAVEKKGVLPVIEVSPEAEGEDPLKPASADRLRGGARRFCEVYRAASAMVTAGGKLFLGEGGRKKCLPPPNPQVMRNISQGQQQALPFISLCRDPPPPQL